MTYRILFVDQKCDAVVLYRFTVLAQLVVGDGATVVCNLACLNEEESNRILYTA